MQIGLLCTIQFELKQKELEKNRSLSVFLLISHWFELCLQITFRNLASHPFNIYPNGLTKIFPQQRSTNGKHKHGHKPTGKTNLQLILLSAVQACKYQHKCNV